MTKDKTITAKMTDTRIYMLNVANVNVSNTDKAVIWPQQSHISATLILRVSSIWRSQIIFLFEVTKIKNAISQSYFGHKI
jgi:hypothetical protein